MNIPAMLKGIRESTGWTQQELAARLEVSQSSVNRWLAGAEPEGHRRDAIRQLFDEVLHRPRNTLGSASIPLMGHVGAGAEVEPDFEQVPPDGLDQIDLPFPVPDDMIAFKVKGGSMLPVYRPDHIIIVYREQRKPLESFLGLEAAVRTRDGKRFIKTVERGLGGIYLRSWNDVEPIGPVELDWIGEIFATLPPAAVRMVKQQGGLQGQLSLKTA